MTEIVRADPKLVASLLAHPGFVALTEEFQGVREKWERDLGKDLLAGRPVDPVKAAYLGGKLDGALKVLTRPHQAAALIERENL